MSITSSLGRLGKSVSSLGSQVGQAISKNTPSMPSLSEIPGMISNTASGFVSNYIDYAAQTIEDAINFDGTQSPEYDRFMRVVENQDMARSNMFLVRFGDFRSTVEKDGVVNFRLDLDGNSSGGGSSLLPGGVKYLWSKAQTIMNDNMKKYVTPKLQKMLGNDAMDIIRMIPGAGELIDGLTGVDYDINRDMALMVKAVNLPGTTLDTQINKTDRMPFHEIRGRTYDHLTVTMYCSPGYDERILMLAWMNQIHNNKKGTYGFYHSYARDIDVVTLDRHGIMTSVVHCQECFPVNVSQVQMSYEDNNMVATVDVEFVMAHMSHNRVKGTNNPVDGIKDLINRTKDLIRAPKKIIDQIKKI